MIIKRWVFFKKQWLFFIYQKGYASFFGKRFCHKFPDEEAMLSLGSNQHWRLRNLKQICTSTRINVSTQPMIEGRQYEKYIYTFCLRLISKNYYFYGKRNFALFCMFKESTSLFQSGNALYPNPILNTCILKNTVLYSSSVNVFVEQSKVDRFYVMEKRRVVSKWYLDYHYFIVLTQNVARNRQEQ